MSFSLRRKEILNTPLQNGSTVFIEAIIAHDYELAEILLKLGADIDGTTDETALQITIKAGNLDTCRFLIEHGCKMTEKDCKIACRYNRHEELLLLLDAGCPPCLLETVLFNGKGFHYRGWQDRSVCAAILLTHGAKKVGHLYPDEINRDVLKLLIAYGIDINSLFLSEKDLEEILEGKMTETDVVQSLEFIQKNGGQSKT